MTRMHQVLKYLESRDVVRLTELFSHFGDSARVTINYLIDKELIRTHADPTLPKVAGFGGVTGIKICDSGRETLKDLETERKQSVKRERWTRGLAIAAILIALLSLLSETGVINLKPPTAQQTTGALTAIPSFRVGTGHPNTLACAAQTPGIRKIP